MTNYKEILKEIDLVLDSIDDEDIERLISLILVSNKVIGYGAGRMGLSLRAFLMRLNHLGIKAYFYGDTYVPPVDSSTLFIASSGSGNTSTVVSLATLAKSRGCKVASITGYKDSLLGKLSDCIVWFRSCNGGLNSDDSNDKINSNQIMSTLNEQSTYILFDIISKRIMNKLEIFSDFKINHTNIE